MTKRNEPPTEHDPTRPDPEAQPFGAGRRPRQQPIPGVIDQVKTYPKLDRAMQDLLVKLPNADKLYLEQMMFSAYCSALRDDKSMSESVKARQILDYRRELQKALKP